MIKKKVLILKNDRGGDLLNSISCISTLLTKNNDVTIYLSNFNFGFFEIASTLASKKLPRIRNFNAFHRSTPGLRIMLRKKTAHVHGGNEGIGHFIMLSTLYQF